MLGESLLCKNKSNKLFQFYMSPILEHEWDFKVRQKSDKIAAKLLFKEMVLQDKLNQSQLQITASYYVLKSRLSAG